MFLCRISIGGLFHSRGPAALKLLSPICDCVRSTAHVQTSDDLRRRHPMHTSVTSWQSSDRYGGVSTRNHPTRDGEKIDMTSSSSRGGFVFGPDWTDKYRIQRLHLGAPRWGGWAAVNCVLRRRSHLSSWAITWQHCRPILGWLCAAAAAADAAYKRLACQ